MGTSSHTDARERMIRSAVALFREQGVHGTSFADVLAFWKQSSGHRTNLLRPNVSAIGVAMAKNKSGRAYWTLVLGGQ